MKSTIKLLTTSQFITHHEPYLEMQTTYLAHPKKLMTTLATLGTTLHLPLNQTRLQKLTENYVVSNEKIKKALGITAMPVSAIDGLRRTVVSFYSEAK